MNKLLKEQLLSSFSDILIDIEEDNKFIINTKEGYVIPILLYLRELGYKHLALISCVDWIDDNEFELVYVLSSYMDNDTKYTEKEKTNILVKTRISREKATSKTVLNIFVNAEPYERELHELFGINFEGHPRLTPLFLEVKYETPTFRKDFDTRKYVKDVFDNIPFVEDRKEK